MTGSLKYKPCIVNFSSHLKFPEEDVFQAPGLLDAIFRMTGSVKYKPGSLEYYSDILILICQLKFPEEDVFQAPGLLDIIFEMKRSLKYKLGILNFSTQLKFPEKHAF